MEMVRHQHKTHEADICPGPYSAAKLSQKALLFSTPVHLHWPNT